MANSTTGIFSTIPGALNESMAAPRFTHDFAKTVFLDDRPAVGAVGETINILIPTVNINNPRQIGGGSVVVNDTAQTSTALTVTQKISNTYKLPTYTSALTEVDLAKFYFNGWIEEVLRTATFDQVNTLIGGGSPMSVGQKVSDVTPSYPSSSNFVANTVVAGSGGHPTRANISTATAALFAGGCPVDDTDNLFLTTSGSPYYAMTSDQTFSYQYIVGDTASEAAQQRGYLVNINGAKIVKDQQFPVNPASGGTIYYAALYHRYAHAVRYMQESTPHNHIADEMFIEPIPGVPMRVEWWYDPSQQAALCSISVLYGAVVARDAYRCLITC